MKKIFVIIVTVTENDTKMVRDIKVEAGFESLESAKAYLRRFTETDEEYRLDASEKILVWKATISTYTREIQQVDMY